MAGRSRLSKTGQVTDGDSLSRAFSKQDVQRVFSEEEAIVLEAQLERAADPVTSAEASPARGPPLPDMCISFARREV